MCAFSAASSTSDTHLGPWASASLRNCCTSPASRTIRLHSPPTARRVNADSARPWRGDDRISNTHADRHDDISHNTIAFVHLTLRERSLAALWQLSRFVIFGQLLLTDL